MGYKVYAGRRTSCIGWNEVDKKEMDLRVWNEQWERSDGWSSDVFPWGQSILRRALERGTVCNSNSFLNSGVSQGSRTWGWGAAGGTD